jgi:hypothetical protein
VREPPIPVSCEAAQKIDPEKAHADGEEFGSTAGTLRQPEDELPNQERRDQIRTREQEAATDGAGHEKPFSFEDLEYLTEKNHDRCLFGLLCVKGIASDQQVSIQEIGLSTHSDSLHFI